MGKQVNVIVPDEAADLIRTVARKIREDQGFAETLGAFLESSRVDLDAPRDSLEERQNVLEEALGALQATVATLADQVAALDASRSSQDGRTVASGSDPKHDSRDELDAIRERLAALEEALANGATMPPQSKPARKRPSKHFEADSQAQPAPEAAAPGERNRAWFLPPTYTRLSEAGIAEIRRRYEAGESDPKIADAMGRTQQGINKITKEWRKGSR